MTDNPPSATMEQLFQSYKIDNERLKKQLDYMELELFRLKEVARCAQEVLDDMPENEELNISACKLLVALKKYNSLFLRGL